MREFIVHLANRPGMLAHLTEAMASAGVSIEALAAFGIDSAAKVHVVVNDEPTARRVLSQNGIHYDEREVLTTTLPNDPGAVAAMARGLAEGGVNIEAMYLLRSSVEGLEFAIAVDNYEPARNQLAV